MRNKANVKTKSVTAWLKNWKRNLLEWFVACGIIASAFTTFAGAFHLVNHSYFVSGLFTMFFQGGLYIVGHYVAPDEHERQHRRRLALCIVWVLLVFFSVWASSLGMYALQQDSIKSDISRANVVTQWRHAEMAVADFKTRALAEITQAKQSVTLDINSERSRIRSARVEHRPYSTENLQRLNADLTALQSADTRLRQLRTLGITPPENSDAARNTLDEIFASTGEAHASLPQRLRASISQPRPVEQTEVSENLQKAFWEGLKSRSVPVVLMLVFAAFLDLLPPLVLFATARKFTLEERVTRFRLWLRALNHSATRPLAEDIAAVDIAIAGVPELSAQVTVAGQCGGPLLDIDRDFAGITKTVCRETGREMLLAAVKTVSGSQLVDGAPLLDQLGQERELVLSYVPAISPDLDVDSQEVN